MILLRTLFAALLLVGCRGPGLGDTLSVLAPSAEEVDLGPVVLGETATREIVLRSLGSGPVLLGEVTLTGDAEFVVSPPAGKSIAPGTALPLTIRFTPVEARFHSATLSIANNTALDPLAVALKGTGVVALDCDDDEACTQDTYDAVANRCVHTPVTGACDDESACTIGDRCEDGVCVGKALACADDDPCTRDLCDPGSGCVFYPDPLVCDDGDACTVDTCDSGRGCRHRPAGDGTLCGEATCASAEVCLSGACTRVPTPDGAPCDDGNLCTVEDACRSGTCVGVTLDQPPEVVASVQTFGTGYDRPVVTAEGRVVVSGSGDIDVIDRSGGELTLTRRTPRSERVVGDLGGSQVVLQRTLTVTAADLAADGGLLLRGSASLPGVPRPVAVSGRTLFACTSDVAARRFSGVDFTDPDAPLVVDGPLLPEGCGSIAVDAGLGRAFVGTDDGIRVIDVAQVPYQAIASVLPHRAGLQVAANGRLVAVLLQASGGRRGIRFLDPATLTELGPSLTRLGTLDDLALVGDALIVLRTLSGEHLLEVFDLADPAAPVLQGSVSSPSSPGGTLQAGPSGLIALRPWSSARALRFFQLEPGGGAPVAITGPLHGGIGGLAPAGSELWTLSADAFNRIDLSTLRAPVVLEGGVLPLESSVYELESGDTWLVDPDRNVFSALVGPWLRLEPATPPQPLGKLWVAPGFRRLAASAGPWLYTGGTSWPGPGEARLEVFDMRVQLPAPTVELAPAGVARVAEASAPSSVSAFALDSRNGRAVMASELLVSPAGESVLHFFDVRTPHAPVHLLEARLPQRVLSLLLAGDRLLVAGPWLSSASRVFEVAWGSGALVELAELPEGHPPIAVEGDYAVLGGGGRAALVDLTSTTPNIAYDLPTSARWAAPLRGALILATEREVSVVYPPCPAGF